jgi:hypothetical protein
MSARQTNLAKLEEIHVRFESKSKLLEKELISLKEKYITCFENGPYGSEVNLYLNAKFLNSTIQFGSEGSEYLRLKSTVVDYMKEMSSGAFEKEMCERKCLIYSAFKLTVVTDLTKHYKENGYPKQLNKLVPKFVDGQYFNQVWDAAKTFHYTPGDSLDTSSAKFFQHIEKHNICLNDAQKVGISNYFKRYINGESKSLKPAYINPELPLHKTH